MTTDTNHSLHHSELGKKTTYHAQYSPELLFPIARQCNRDALGLSSPLPFYGEDVWNAYELSWLNNDGKPEVAIGKFIFPCTSPALIESKSLKLYLNSFNNTRFSRMEDVITIIEKDLSHCAGIPVSVSVTPLSQMNTMTLDTFEGQCLDTLEIQTQEYQINPALLTTETAVVQETVYSHLLKSNCPVTHQPDWGSVRIYYTGCKINHENLLKYIISYRNHNEFHESCIERIFMDIVRRCNPTQLTVEAHYTRRGGLDINPIRTTHPTFLPHALRHWRQ